MFNPGRFSMCTAIETAKFDPQLLSNVGHQRCWQTLVRAESSAGYRMMQSCRAKPSLLWVRRRSSTSGRSDGSYG
jgi:hypothetical protein